MEKSTYTLKEIQEYITGATITSLLLLHSLNGLPEDGEPDTMTLAIGLKKGNTERTLCLELDDVQYRSGHGVALAWDDGDIEE